ncbi:MAG TPA: hypothetical protein ENH29_06060, partial [Bacteroidetes bacterium]|nr:hypothetical protein [Bacteroidota bacterium]
MANLPKIGSLISVPEVETVIRLDIADSEDEPGSRNLLSSFVVTDEIERAFQQFFHRALNRRGGAAFLRGNYGSGKSHFLAVLSLLLESTKLWEYIRYPQLQEFKRLSEQKILVVKVALHNFSAGESLESILFGETEKILQHKIGETVLLRRGAMLVEHFNRYVLPQHPEFLREIKQTKSEWAARSQQQPQKAIQQAYSFIQKNQIPLRAVFDRREALEILHRELEAADYDGTFWALDELSEFLKAKPSSALFTEDLRFLQFLGEACTGDADTKTTLPVYLIAALQENIEKTGYIEKDLVYRIKDRFPLRFSLSAHHVNQLIARRLICKKTGALPQIKTIYRSFVTAFPQAEIEENDFVAIYPIHPDTVQLLEGLTPIFSQHRGVVDFIYHQLTGDDNRGWPGMLDLPASELMTPDTIFDHFKDRLREISELASYVDVVFLTVQKDIDRLFDSPEDRLLAAKAVKILILNELNLVKIPATVYRLSQMLNRPVSDLDESLNTGYLKEVILKKLVQEGSFVAKGKLDSGEFTYFISMEMTVHQMVRNRVQEFFSQPVKMEQELPDLFVHLQNALIPFTALGSGKRRKYGFDWQNTHREGWVFFKQQPRWDGGELDELNRDLLTSEQDFAFFIIGSEKTNWPEPPQFSAGLFQNSFAGVILAWVPRPFQIAEIEFLRRFRAYEMVDRQLGGSVSPQEKQMRQIVTEWLEAHRSEFVNIVEDVYLHGRIADTRGWRDFQFAPFYSDFKSILKQIFSPVLQEAFPRHSEIMPGDVMPPFVGERLFLQFIKPGGLPREEARSQNVDQLIETYLKPLGIVASDPDQYNLSLSDDGNGLLAHFLQECTGENPVSLYSLYWRLRKGEWGIAKGQFQLLLGALLAAGRLTAFLAGNAVPFRSIAQLGDGSIEAVGEGKLISEVVQQALKPFLQLSGFQTISAHFSISAQEQFWRLLKEFKHEVRALLKKWQSLSRRYESYPAYRQIVDPEELDLLLLEEFCDNIRVSFPAREGLEKLVEEIGAARIQQVPDWFRHLHSMTAIVENRFVELNQIYVYL